MARQSHLHPLQLRRAALLAHGRQLRAALTSDLDELAEIAARRPPLQDQLLQLGRNIALRSIAGAVENLRLPGWLRVARLVLRGWRLWRRLRR